MRLKRILSATLGAALLGIVPVALIASPAQAATTLETRVVVQAQPKNVYSYGQQIAVVGRVEVYATCQRADGTTYTGWCAVADTSNGQVQLRRRMGGTSTWTTVATHLNERSFTMYTEEVGTAEYQVHYTGGTYNADFSFGPSSSSNVIKGKRKLTLSGLKSGGKLFVIGKVTPNFANRTVIVQRRTCGTCSWTKYTQVRASSYGNYKARIYAPRSGSWYYRTVVSAQLPRWYASISPNTIRAYRS